MSTISLEDDDHFNDSAHDPSAQRATPAFLGSEPGDCTIPEWFKRFHPDETITLLLDDDELGVVKWHQICNLLNRQTEDLLNTHIFENTEKTTTQLTSQSITNHRLDHSGHIPASMLPEDHIFDSINTRDHDLDYQTGRQNVLTNSSINQSNTALDHLDPVSQTNNQINKQLANQTNNRSTHPTLSIKRSEKTVAQCLSERVDVEDESDCDPEPSGDQPVSESANQLTHSGGRQNLADHDQPIDQPNSQSVTGARKRKYSQLTGEGKTYSLPDDQSIFLHQLLAGHMLLSNWSMLTFCLDCFTCLIDCLIVYLVM